jgi:O-acetyl-ADP-ribose deacetylase
METFGGIAMKERITLAVGDITEVEADAIVNAANSQLILGGGVAGAIARKGGPAIQAECDKIGHIKLGGAAVTGAGKLKAKMIIHAASMDLGGNATGETLKSAIKSTFDIAENKGVRSIAFPAVGAGISGFPMRRCAEIMMDEARRTIQKGKIEKIMFVLFDKPAYDAFKEAYDAVAD